MPEAIATTKRKFYKALDALATATSQVVPHNLELGIHKRPVSAAVAFDEARERVRKRLRHSTSTASLVTLSQASQSTSVARKSTSSPSTNLAQATDSAKDRPPPNFAPWSHDAFLTRLKTFSSVSRWHPKPEEISEVQWAKRGWICADVNTVSCRGGCEKRVVVSLNASSKPAQIIDEDVGEGQDPDGYDDDDSDATTALEEAFVKRYKAEIINGHADNCLWHQAGCKNDIYRLQVVRPSVWQPDLRSRFRSVLDIGDSIIQVNFKASDPNSQNTISTERLLKGLPSDVLGTYDAPSTTGEIALKVALHGWHGSSEAGNQLLRCNACFQRVGLWMYQPNYRPGTRGRSAPTSDDDDGAASKPGEVDLLEMHREHCPWRNPGSQYAIGSLSGLNACQILQRVTATCVRDHRRRTGDQRDLGATHQEQHGEVAEDLAVEQIQTYSRAEIAAQDQERESRLRKLKNLFSIKRRSTVKSVNGAAS